MKNQRMLAEACKSLDRELDGLFLMASAVFPQYRVSPLRWLIAALRSPFRR